MHLIFPRLAHHQCELQNLDEPDAGVSLRYPNGISLDFFFFFLPSKHRPINLQSNAFGHRLPSFCFLSHRMALSPTHPAADDQTPLLSPPADGNEPKKPTPLPRVQICVLMLSCLIEPIASQCIYPFINQVSVCCLLASLAR